MALIAAFLGLLVVQRLVAATVVPAHTIGNASWPYQTYKTVNFTPPYLQISRKIDPQQGFLFFAPDGATEYELAPLIMDINGELVWNGPRQHAFSFGVQKYHDQPVLVWWNGTLFPEPVGRGNGEVYLYNSKYELIHTTTLEGNFVEQVRGATFSSSIDVHEIFLTPNNTMLVTANNVTQANLTSVGGPANGWVVAALVYEIDIATNNVLFSWNSLDHLDQIPFSASLLSIGAEGLTGANQSLAWGYFHINSVSPYNGGYLLSSRYLCSAIAISKTGSVDWRLQGRTGGDFTLGNGTNFCYQHDIRAVPQHPHGRDGKYVTLHLHDNHNAPIETGIVPTSGKSLLLDLETKQVTLLQQYLNASGPTYVAAQGNFQLLPNGNVFLGHGVIPILEEYSRSGEILTTIQFGAATARPAGGFVTSSTPTLSYRAFRQPWVGCPTTLPDVVAQTGANGTVVYVSWNGATEVEAWQVYGGNTTTLSHILTVPKSGFETAAEIRKVQYVEVKPVLRRRRHGEKGCNTGGVSSGIVAAVP